MGYPYQHPYQHGLGSRSRAQLLQDFPSSYSFLSLPTYNNTCWTQSLVQGASILAGNTPPPPGGAKRLHLHESEHQREPTHPLVLCPRIHMQEDLPRRFYFLEATVCMESIFCFPFHFLSKAQRFRIFSHRHYQSHTYLHTKRCQPRAQ